MSRYMNVASERAGICVHNIPLTESCVYCDTSTRPAPRALPNECAHKIPLHLTCGLCVAGDMPGGMALTGDDVAATLKERGGRYGDFAGNGRAAQEIKRAMRREAGWMDLNDVQREALELMATKISRILTGDANHADHWLDLVGYAQLGGAGIGAPDRVG